MLKRFANECPLPIIKEDIHLGKKIGEGTSEVYQATVKDKDYAVKIYNSNIYNYLNFKQIKSLINDHIEGRENRRLLIWSLLNVDEYLNQNF